MPRASSCPPTKPASYLLRARAGSGAERRDWRARPWSTRDDPRRNIAGSGEARARDISGGTPSLRRCPYSSSRFLLRPRPSIIVRTRDPFLSGQPLPVDFRLPVWSSTSYRARRASVAQWRRAASGGAQWRNQGGAGRGHGPRSR
jgi:hypothetical protein